MIDNGTIMWFLGLPSVTIRAPGVLRVYLLPYAHEVGVTLAANRHSDRRRVKRELRKLHDRLLRKGEAP